tara:strand:+ start:880 stop:1548 length:669 start_codon:yes stop_codon:yes gene_type:complete
MPPKKLKVPDGEMNATELRKLIRAHNILVSIKIPKGTDRDGLIALIQGKGYKVDHKNKKIVDAKKDRPRRPVVTLEKAKELTKPKPVSEEEKKKRQQARQKKKGEKAFLKVAIPKAPPVSKKPSKVIKVGKPPPMKEAPKKDTYMERVKYVRKNNEFGDKIAFVEIKGEKYDWDGLNVKDGFGKKVAEFRDPKLLEKWFEGVLSKYNIPEVGKNKGLKMIKD